MPANLFGGDPGRPIEDPVGGRDAFAFAVCGGDGLGPAGFRAVAARAREEGVDFLVVCGGLGGEPEPEAFRSWARTVRDARFEKPVFVVPGEGDEQDWTSRRLDLTVYRRLFGRTPYAFRAGPNLFVGIDTVRWKTDPAEREGFERLVGDRAGVRRLFVFGHHRIEECVGAGVPDLAGRLRASGCGTYFAGHGPFRLGSGGEGIREVVAGPVGPAGASGASTASWVVVRATPSGVEEVVTEVPIPRGGLIEESALLLSLRAFRFWRGHRFLAGLAAVALGAWTLGGLARVRGSQPPPGRK